MHYSLRGINLTCAVKTTQGGSSVLSVTNTVMLRRRWKTMFIIVALLWAYYLMATWQALHKNIDDVLHEPKPMVRYKNTKWLISEIHVLDRDGAYSREIHPNENRIDENVLEPMIGNTRSNKLLDTDNFTQTGAHMKHGHQDDKRINIFESQYLKNTDVCKTRNGISVHTLILVSSAIHDQHQRQRTREMWGSVKKVGDKRVETVFLVGTSKRHQCPGRSGD